MTTDTILASIQNWLAIRNNDAQLISFLSQGYTFEYDFNTQETSPYIHAYPGINNGQLYFFMIPSNYDCEEYSKDIDLYTTICPVTWPMGTNRIPSSTAKARINAWKNNYQIWVPKQTKTTDGIFMAFNIAVQDFESFDPTVSLGLKGSGTTASPFTAELIVTNPTASAVFYDDYTTPVPPFGASATVNDFYLLQL